MRYAAATLELSGHVKTDDRADATGADCGDTRRQDDRSAASLYIVGEPYCDVLTLSSSRSSRVSSVGYRKEIGNPAQQPA